MSLSFKPSSMGTSCPYGRGESQLGRSHAYPSAGPDTYDLCDGHVSGCLGPQATLGGCQFVRRSIFIAPDDFRCSPNYVRSPRAASIATSRHDCFLVAVVTG